MNRRTKTKQIKKSKIIWLVIASIVFVVFILTAIFFINAKSLKLKTDVFQTPVSFVKPVIKDEIKENITYTYYDISGTTRDELSSQMTELGPECDDECFARINSSIDWSYPISQANSCEPVEVIASIEYILPRWTNQQMAPKALQEKWKNYEKKLLAHEEKHKDITVEFAKQFLAKIKELNNEDYGSCWDLEQKIGNYHATGEILNASSQAQEELDRETDHGAKQGVIW